jgi:hypothetical protein
MVFNAVFYNILVISWRSVLLVEDTVKTTDLSQVTDKLYRVTWYLALHVCFVDRCLSFCTFSFGHCSVCSFSCLIDPLVYSSCSYHIMFYVNLAISGVQTYNFRGDRHWLQTRTATTVPYNIDIFASPLRIYNQGEGVSMLEIRKENVDDWSDCAWSERHVYLQTVLFSCGLAQYNLAKRVGQCKVDIIISSICVLFTV